MEVDPDLIVPDPDQTLAGGAITPWGSGQISEYYSRLVKALAEEFGSDVDTPFAQLPAPLKDALLNGYKHQVRVRYRNRFGRERQYTTGFEGVIPFVQRRYAESESDTARERYEGFMREVPCPACDGARLKPVSLAVTVGGANISAIADLPISGAAEFLGSLDVSDRDAQIAARVLKEVNERLAFLMDVGLHYLSLSRPAATLAGGEAQRIRLATQIGSGLVGVLYVLDEPSIGLHQRDNHRLIDTLVRLRELGNTLIVVEHDEDTIRTADWVVDIGPGAGEHGGQVVVSGTVEDLLRHPDSITGQYLSGKRRIEVPAPAPHDRPIPDARRRRRPGAQPAERHRGVPARLLRRDHRRERVGQVDADQRRAVHGPGPRSQRRAQRPRAAPPGARSGPPRQGRARRPEPDRAYAAVQPGDLHRRVRPHPQAVRGHPGGEDPRLPARAVLLQRQGRPVRGVHRATARSRSR